LSRSFISGGFLYRKGNYITIDIPDTIGTAVIGVKPAGATVVLDIDKPAAVMNIYCR
jgi:hypothetical protein